MTSRNKKAFASRPKLFPTTTTAPYRSQQQTAHIPRHSAAHRHWTRA
jgi:hypothetical protein